MQLCRETDNGTDYATSPLPSISRPSPRVRPPQAQAPWHGMARLQFTAADGITSHQGLATAPLKLQRGFQQRDGRRGELARSGGQMHLLSLLHPEASHRDRRRDDRQAAVIEGPK